MMILLASLVALGDSTPAIGQPVEQLASARQPLRLWINNDRRFRPGDRVRVQVDVDASGYLLVLNYDTEGRLRVIFPLDPRDDAQVEAGRRYEIRAEGADEAFRAAGDGTGFIYSAIASDRWRLEEITLADRWDITRLEIDQESNDPEAEVTSLVQRMAGSGGFDYDVLGYRVQGQPTAAYYNTYVYPRGPTYIYDDYVFCNNWSWRYDGCHRWPYDGGWSFGIGFYRPFYYGSSYYGGYYPSRYRYGYGYNYPYYPSYPSFPIGKAPVIVGRSRGYAIQPRGTFTPLAPRNGSFGSVGTRGGIGRPAPAPRRIGDLMPSRDAGRARGPIRPAGDRVGRGPVDAGGPNISAPPARRSREEGRYVPTPARGGDRVGPGARNDPGLGRGESSGREAPPRARSEPSRREPPPARAEPSRRDPPQARSEPSRREPPSARARPEPSRREPPASRSEPSRREAPPQVRGGSGGGGGGSGSSGSSGRARGRRP